MGNSFLNGISEKGPSEKHHVIVKKFPVEALRNIR